MYFAHLSNFFIFNKRTTTWDVDRVFAGESYFNSICNNDLKAFYVYDNTPNQFLSSMIKELGNV